MPRAHRLQNRAARPADRRPDEALKFSVFSYLMSLLHPRVIADLELAKYGYGVLPATDMFGPLPGKDYIVFADDVAKTQRSFARFSAKDAAIRQHGRPARQACRPSLRRPRAPHVEGRRLDNPKGRARAQRHARGG